MESTDQSKPAVAVTGNSPERIYVTEDNCHEDNVRRHIARYEFAARHIPAMARILDCACGTGYGSQILTRRAKWSYLTGVDCSAEAIHYARHHHQDTGDCYLHHRIEDLVLPPESMDAVVTLETIEHLPPDVCRQFLARAPSWVKPGGVVVASSPMLRYKDGQPYVTSPYHINELPREELLAMLADAFPSTGWVRHLYHQEQEAFLPLLDEHEGFCVMAARRRMP